MERLWDPNRTALVVIDLQRWIGNQYAPYSAEQVVSNAAALAETFREQGSMVVLVRVSSKDMKDLPRPKLDSPAPPLNLTEGWDQIVPEMRVAETDHIITKKQWGAFYGTELDLQLRRRGIDTIVLCGIATEFGVDTTAREAFMHGYQLILAIDAMTGFTEAGHEHVTNFIFPRIGRNRTTQDIISALSDS
ncbi:hydrolase [Paenibacillus xylaniclasticus]|uniref:hydrolase n=1 Tax=Paenibacillus xylaniclasticus TaxID=588083 RepID=UPI00175019B1|nr:MULTISPECIES: hydrolase [Paenibacillus]GFN32295.1 putative isochorismatase family protein [Paenibacillus curdlanolyticus]